MYLLLAALALLPQGTDTTVAVRAGVRLDLRGHQGTIRVTTWNRDAVRIQTDDDGEVKVKVTEDGAALKLRARSRHGPASASWRLTVPAAMPLELSTMSGDIEVDGAKGEVDVSSMNGNITLRGGAGLVELETVSGSIRVSEAGGRMRLTTVDGDITVTGVRGGPLTATAVSGQIRLEGVDATEVEANTVDGEIRFAGAIQAHGRYRLTSHAGDVTVTAPAINATVSVSTFSGDFETDFPATIPGVDDRRRFTFTLGDGGARIELESFDGHVALRRTGGRGI